MSRFQMMAAKLRLKSCLKRKSSFSKLNEVIVSVPTLLLVVTAMSELPWISNGHSLLMEPVPYGWSCRGCSTCPAPLRWVNGSSAWNSQATWERGESVGIRWERNNHNGGFARLSLVPLTRMYNATAHSRLAFLYTCWGHGRYLCAPGHACGSDTRRQAHRRRIRVPDVVPDGEYVLALMWFGGLHWSRTRGRFGDHVTCARVQVKGGVPLGRDSYVPRFQPGPGGLSGQQDRCLASADAPGICPHGCPHVPAEYMIPAAFANGSTPYSLRPTDFEPSLLPLNNFNLSSSSTNSSSLSSITDNDPGVCHRGICCATSCRVCFQPGCRYRPGGGKRCCPRHIRRAGRKCHNVGAPCFVVQGRGIRFT